MRHVLVCNPSINKVQYRGVPMTLARNTEITETKKNKTSDLPLQIGSGSRSGTQGGQARLGKNMKKTTASQVYGLQVVQLANGPAHGPGHEFCPSWRSLQNLHTCLPITPHTLVDLRHPPYFDLCQCIAIGNIWGYAGLGRWLRTADD